ncbi:DUF4328 domain-containing protein [Amycolatopsis cynarae]|uniref:DUF4328 domain-containing protein n=1 Tax=Amycolatopsis cynarae TaxID=2995223 RepID=A0ABY7B8J6_9PSEU|nr:DUF4328 domain-containing protein [Amycolatopsis sp. HUAS 11-8]WAL68665.1 DUF4328 domain-containing protein [Amycolatopsis sp. HUAS 11-8]
MAREILVLASNWRDYFVVRDYLAGAATDTDVEAVDSDALAVLASWPTILVWIACGVAFLVWLWRARINAELNNDAAVQRRSRGWVVGAWIAPVVNLWYPYQIVSDIWRASSPRPPAPVALINAWWAAFVAAGLVKPIQWRLAEQESSLPDVLGNANMSTLLTGLDVVAGTLLILVIRRITAWQNQVA